MTDLWLGIRNFYFLTQKKEAFVYHFELEVKDSLFLMYRIKKSLDQMPRNKTDKEIKNFQA